MITLEQAREIKRADRLKIFIGHEQSKLDTFPPMKNAIVKFNTDQDELAKAATGKNTETKWITKDKTELKEEVGHDGEMICALAHAFADEFGHDDLAAATNLSYDKFIKTKDENMMSLVTGVINAIKPFIGTPDFNDYSITSTTLDDWNKKASEFTKLIGAADEGQTHNTTDNEKIDAAIKKVIKDIRKMEKLIVFWKSSDAELVNAFYLNSAIDNSGIRHNGIEGLVSDENGVVLSKAVIKLKNTKYEAVSDLKGFFRLIEARAGDYIAEVFADGCLPYEQLLHISPRKVEEMNFVLKRIP